MQRDSPVALHTATSVSQNTPSNKIDAKWRFSVPLRASDILILVTVRHDDERCTLLLIEHYMVMGTVWDWVVGIVTCYRLDGPGAKSLWGRDFLHPFKLVQPWGPTSPLHNGYRITFLGVKWLGHAIDHLPASG